jgi:hypothetical protein
VEDPVKKTKSNGLSFEKVESDDRRVVVTAARAGWKGRHANLTEMDLRTLRFIWMRDLMVGDCFKLNATRLGRLTNVGWVYYEKGVMMLSPAAKKALEVK